MDVLDTMIDENLILSDLEVSSKEDMVDKLVSVLESKGYVKNTYKEALMEREKVFPTGLDTGEIKVCVPHTDSCHVNKAGILIATLKNSIKYKRMDDPSSEIDVNVVFMLAVKDPKEQVPTLGRLMSLFSKPSVLKEIKKERSAINIKKIILDNAE